MTQLWTRAGTIARKFNQRGEAVINQREQELHQTAKRFAEQMGPQFDVDLDFTPASLAGLDDMLGKMIDMSEPYRSDNTRDLLPVALAVTAYVGEVFRRSFSGATWITDHQAGEVPPPHIRLTSGMRLNLMKKSLQILTRADSTTFAGYFQTVEDLAQSRDAEPGGNA